MKNDFKVLNERINELTKQSELASARSQLFALQALALARQAQALSRGIGLGVAPKNDEFREGL